MAAEEGMMQAIMQAAVEGITREILVVREADTSVNSARPIHTTPRSDSPALRHPTFH